MAQSRTKQTQSIKEIENDLDYLINYSKSRCLLCYNQIGKMFSIDPCRLGVFAKNDLIHPIQQGPKKMLTYRECKMVECYIYLIDNCNASFSICRVIQELLTKYVVDPDKFLQAIKKGLK
jgi:hypothetical protein